VKMPEENASGAKSSPKLFDEDKMSKVGNKKIIIPERVSLENADGIIKVKGEKGELSLELTPNIEVKINSNLVAVGRKKDDKQTKSLHGLTQRLIGNMIIGVSEGFQKKLDFKGVGFKAEVSGNKLVLNVGFSHPVEVIAPEGIAIEVQKNIITVSGIDKQKVGQIAADIRAVKPVEPYKGKGIKYIDEIPRRKPGKAAKAIVGSV